MVGKGLVVRESLIGGVVGGTTRARGRGTRLFHRREKWRSDQHKKRWIMYFRNGEGRELRIPERASVLPSTKVREGTAEKESLGKDTGYSSRTEEETLLKGDLHAVGAQNFTFP